MTSAHSDQRSWTRMREIHRVITVHSEEQEIDFVNCLGLSTTVNPKKHWTRTDCELLKVIHRWHVCFCKNWCETKRAKFSLKYPKDRSQKRVFGSTARSIHRINKRTRSTQSIQSTWYINHCHGTYLVNQDPVTIEGHQVCLHHLRKHKTQYFIFKLRLISVTNKGNSGQAFYDLQ